jgi:hypothetical protein
MSWRSAAARSRPSRWDSPAGSAVRGRASRSRAVDEYGIGVWLLPCRRRLATCMRSASCSIQGAVGHQACRGRTCEQKGVSALPHDPLFSEDVPRLEELMEGPGVSPTQYRRPTRGPEFPPAAPWNAILSVDDLWSDRGRRSHLGGDLAGASGRYPFSFIEAHGARSGPGRHRRPTRPVARLIDVSRISHNANRLRQARSLRASSSRWRHPTPAAAATTPARYQLGSGCSFSSIAQLVPAVTEQRENRPVNDRHEAGGTDAQAATVRIRRSAPFAGRARYDSLQLVLPWPRGESRRFGAPSRHDLDLE